MSTSPTKVLVTVHGIGDQTRYQTLQQLVNLCFGQSGEPKGVSIGYLHSELSDGEAWATVGPLPAMGFAEVFWADIGRNNESYVLEESVAWSHTIVERLGVVSNRVNIGDPFDYDKIKRVLTDIGIAIRLSRWLNRGLTALGMGSFDLENTLVRYLGDVQLYSEFRQFRTEIMGRFRNVMNAIAAKSADADIHICGHSQGSVVAFLGLLEGYKAQEEWVSRVKSLITIGSPIDKFLLLWPELWIPFTQDEFPFAPEGPGIRWMNYADRGDPVGYELDTARKFIQDHVPQLFAATAPTERIYRRYVIPGKAHIDYWKDQEVFNEWLATSGIVAGTAPRPGDRWLAKLLAPILPFLVSATFGVLAAHLYATGINQIYAARNPGKPEVVGLLGVLAIALLLQGTAALASAARTSVRGRWILLGIVLFLAGAAFTLIQLLGDRRNWTHGPVLTVIVLLGVVALVQNAFNWTRRVG
jgi:hypothetical protein